MLDLTLAPDASIAVLDGEGRPSAISVYAADGAPRATFEVGAYVTPARIALGEEWLAAWSSSGDTLLIRLADGARFRFDAGADAGEDAQLTLGFAPGDAALCVLELEPQVLRRYALPGS